MVRTRISTFVLVIAAMTSQLVGCTVMKTKQERRNAESKQENVVLRGNYQALLKCWDDNAEKQSIDFVNQTFSQVYQDLGIAEITVGGAFGRYAVYIELKRDTVDRTIVNAYGTGYLGASKVPEWLSLLNSCQSKIF